MQGRAGERRSLAVLFTLIPQPKRPFISHLSRIEESLSPFSTFALVSRFVGLFLGLSLVSYNVRALLFCWLYFGLLFGALFLLVLGAVFAYQAGKIALDWVAPLVSGSGGAKPSSSPLLP